MFESLQNINIPVAVAVLAAGFFGVKFLFSQDTKVEDRRAGAFDLSQDAAKEGIDFVVPVLKAYSVGDYSGLLHELKSISTRFRDEDARKAAMDKLVKVQIERRMKDPERRVLLEKHIEQLKAQEKVTTEVKDANQASNEKEAPGVRPDGGNGGSSAPALGSVSNPEGS